MSDQVLRTRQGSQSESTPQGVFDRQTLEDGPKTITEGALMSFLVGAN